jgi:hypothetical protein
MMKNTEWGAVTFLSHSKYGINKEININNHYKFLTGYSSTSEADQSKYQGVIGTDSSITMPYNTETGYLASTTGNISGIYDMSGGSYEVMAAYTIKNIGQCGFTTDPVNIYGNKYFDVYPESERHDNFNNRILGDATGEMGSFYWYDDEDGTTRRHNSWYSDFGYSNINGRWTIRGGRNFYGVVAGQFNFYTNTGEANNENGFRVVLAS